MPRILGLDVGSKRIGVAMSDFLSIIAQPLKVVNREPEDKAIEEIYNICKENDINKVIVGLPKNMNNSIGLQAEDVITFSKKIETKLNISVIFEDERLTSVQAERILVEQNKKASKKNKGLIDITSAGIILQQYLDRK
jgi:putative holliday junction resolvase